MALLFQIHSSIITSLIYDHSLLLSINLGMSLSILTMVCNLNPEVHRIHTFRNNVYRLLLLIVRSLGTLSSNFECLTYISELSMNRILIICKISNSLMTIFLHEPDCTSLNTFELQHLWGARTYYPFLQYPKNIVHYRTWQILNHTCTP